MTKKTKAELKAQVDANIKTNGNREITPAKHNAIETNEIDSFLNIVEGGLVVDALTGYSSVLTPTDDKHWTTKKYVDDEIASATPAGGLLAANNLDDLDDLPTALTNLGLDNVDNTSDANKPVSTAQAAADAAVLSTAQTYADNIALGLKWKAPVLVATTANITLSGEQTLDGILTSASRVLVKNQSDATQNGIYVSAAGAWARSTDANSAAELEGAAVIIQKGTVGANLGYTQTADDIVLGVTNLAFAQFAGSTASFASLTGAYSDNTSLNNKIVAMDATAAGKQTAFTAQNANLIYAGPGSGAAALPTFRSMVNADLPAGVPTRLPEVGTIITETWANLSAWTNVGTGTFSVAGNQLTVNGGSPGSIQVGNYIRHSGYGNTQYVKWTAEEFNITVGTINATSWGVGFGVQSQNSNSLISCIFGIMLDSTNKGNIFLFGNASNTIISRTPKPLTVSAGDVLTVKIIRGYNEFICILTNTSLTDDNTISLVATSQDFATLFFAANIGQFSVFALGGTDHKITSSLSINCNHAVGSTVLMVGDSRTYAGGVNPLNNFVNALGDIIDGKVDFYAGSGDRNQDYVAAEILAMDADIIFILSGTNNIGFGDSAAVATGYMTTLINALVAGGRVFGVDLFLSDELPATGTDRQALSNLYKSTYSLSGIIYTYTTFLASSGTGPDPLYFETDLLHLNTYGYHKFANVIARQLPVTIKNTPYFSRNTIRKGVFGNVFIANNAALEVTEVQNGSMIHFSNGSSARGGGWLYSNTDNQASVQAGCYSSIGGTVIASATSGSVYGQNAAQHTWFTFSGATIGNAVTPVQALSLTATALTFTDGVNKVFGTTTGTKHGTATTQKQSFWNATPIVQPTTSVAASTFVANTSAIANDTATFDGYTIGQIVKALRNIGLLA